MATGGAGMASNAQPIAQPSHRGAPAPSSGIGAVSPPSKRELASWWRKFRKTTERPDEKPETTPGIFGVPLSESIRYANVAISLTNEQGESFIYGYVPIVVAKCGVFLKEKATDIEGIFRLSGSAKRIKDLQTIFNSPDRYGKGLDWTGYTVHDAANILRRYLNQLPEPIVPLDFYERFRDPLRKLASNWSDDGTPHTTDINVAEHAAAVESYQQLIKELPALNRQLLLYILDLLAVFASKSDLNRMNAANLAAIFQPGILSHPSHDMAPQEYRLSQDVVIFLIENQDNFLFGMTGTAVDEQTQKDVESGAPSAKSPKTNIGRSASNASAGADSLRKYGVRRNVSVSSHTSRERSSPGISSPSTPSGTTGFTSASAGGAIARSNTVPSKRSPAITQNRFPRVAESSDANPQAGDSINAATGSKASSQHATETGQGTMETLPQSAVSEPSGIAVGGGIDRSIALASSTIGMSEAQQPKQQAALDDLTPAPGTSQSPASGSGESRERRIPSLFSRSPIFGPSEAQQRAPKKLQKKNRIPGSANESAQNSQNSLHGGDESVTFHTPLVSPELATTSRNDPMIAASPAVINTAPTPVSDTPTMSQGQFPPTSNAQDMLNHTPGLRGKSPNPSIHSRSSITDHSEFDNLDDAGAKADKSEKRRHRWRFSTSAKKNDDSPLAPPPPIGQNPGARGSNSSFGSTGRPRKSFTGESQLTQQTAVDNSGNPSLLGQSSHESTDPSNTDTEKKGLFGRFKAKMSQAKEEKKERDAEKERARSPPRTGEAESVAPRGSLSALAHEHFSRGRSMDLPREEPSVKQTETMNTSNEITTVPGPTLSSAISGEQPQTEEKTASSH